MKDFYQEMKQFCVVYDDLPDGAFFALAEEQGITIDDWAWYSDEWKRRKDKF